MIIDPDLMLIVGLVFAVLSVPSIIGAFSESRAPRLGIIMIVIGAGMVAWAINAKPGEFSFEELPETFISVIARYLG